jgi:hypothetical protein
MSVDQTQRHCKTCDKPTLHQRSTFSFGWGCLLTILTSGLFIPIWILISMFGLFKPWRCQVCGKARMI